MKSRLLPSMLVLALLGCHGKKAPPPLQTTQGAELSAASAHEGPTSGVPLSGDFRPLLEKSELVRARRVDQRFARAGIALVGLDAEATKTRFADGAPQTPRSFPVRGSGAPLVVANDSAEAWFSALGDRLPKPAKTLTAPIAGAVDRAVPMNTVGALNQLALAERALAKNGEDGDALASGAAAAASLVLLLDDGWERTDGLAARAIELYVRATRQAGASLPNTKAALTYGLGYAVDREQTTGVLSAFLGDREQFARETALEPKDGDREARLLLQARFEHDVQPLFDGRVVPSALAASPPSPGTFLARAHRSTFDSEIAFGRQAPMELDAVLASVRAAATVFSTGIVAPKGEKKTDKTKAFPSPALPPGTPPVLPGEAAPAIQRNTLGELATVDAIAATVSGPFAETVRGLGEALVLTAAHAPYRAEVARSNLRGAAALLAQLEEGAITLSTNAGVAPKPLPGIGPDPGAAQAEASAKAAASGIVVGASASLATPFTKRLRADKLVRSKAGAATVLKALRESRAVGGLFRGHPASGPETAEGEAYLDEVALVADRRPSHTLPFASLVGALSYAHSHIYQEGAAMLGGSQHAVIAGEGACSVQLRGTVSGAGTADVQAEPHQAGRPNSAALTAVLENPRCSSFERLSALISKEIDIPRQARDQNAPAGTASGPDPVIDPVQSFDTFAQQNDFDTDTATEMANRLAERGADGAEAALLDRWIARNSKRVDVNAAGVRSSRARVLLRQQKFAEAKALLAPVLYTNVANVVLNAAIAEAGLGNRSQSEALLSRAERAYVGRSANAVDRGVCTALWGDSKGAAAAFFAGNKDDDFASFARALSIVLPRGRSEGGNAPGTAEHTTPAGFDVKTFAGEFFGPAADAEKRRFGARLAHQLTTYPNAHARDAFLGSIPRTLDWGTDPGPALDVYMALRRNPSSTAASEARLFLEGAVPPPQRKGPFGDFALLAGAYDLFDDVIVAPTTFATPTEESNLMVAVIAKAASMGPSDPVKKLADRISAPKSHYGFAAKWMAVSDPAVTEDSMIQLATDARKGAEISCYLGLGFAMRGDHEKAIRYLRATVRSNHPRLMEVRLAEQILRKYQTHSLEGLPPGLPR